MSKFAIISDIHANYEALGVVISHLIEEDIDEIICLGDIIGYNGSPVECLELVRDMAIPSLQGNHERYVFGGTPDHLKEAKRYVLDWTRETLGPERVEYLRNLPEEDLYQDKFLLVHGSPTDKDEYILSNMAIKKNLKFLKSEKPEISVCFFGHTHYPMIIGPGMLERKFHETRTVELNQYKSYLVNPGSVGQPRDECPLASFAVFDRDEWTATIHRLPYDIEGAQEKVRQAGIDPRLANRLAYGK